MAVERSQRQSSASVRALPRRSRRRKSRVKARQTLWMAAARGSARRPQEKAVVRSAEAWPWLQ
eukprot:1986258-Alexandrium_andersonii.AAC.1